VACQRLGYTREELLGLTPRDITMPEEYTRLLDKREKLMSKGDIINESVHVTRDGRQIPVESSVRLFNYLGKRAAISISRDITERKQAEEDKEKLRTQLVQAQKMEAIGHLAGGIAHDFNNVLAAIVGYASLLRMKMKNDDPLRPNVEQILFATERATTLVRSLLVFSRKQIMDTKPVRINDIVSSVLKLLASLLGEDITIETIYDARGPHVMADAGQIDQVLINLATNARDAMPEGGHLTITTDVTAIDDFYIREHGYGVPGDYALITVSDTGAGMDRATQEKIFEPFFTTKEVGKGTGLGLSTAYGIVKQHSGFINCYSEPGKGTTFKIYLPLLKPGEKAEIGQVRKGAELTPRGSETVLVAEDDASVRKLIVYILEQYGYNVYEAADGEEAVKVFQEHAESINLLLLDVIMPHKNGREAYREIVKIRPDMKALFTSGYTADIIEKRGFLEEGFEAILKPVLLTALLQKVRQVLDRKR
jgi:PAS domain S-box-containing protein